MKRLALMCVCVLSVAALFGATPMSSEDRAQLNKFNQFYSLLTSYYIEDVDAGPLVEEAIRAIIKELDPHSSYCDVEEMRSIRENLEGEFSGVGIEFAVVDDTLRVVRTISGAPAEKVGVMANDRIITIDSLSIIGITQADVHKRLRGAKGSRVDIEVLRGGSGESLLFSIVRDNIPINTVDAAYKLTPTSGYIRVNRFGETTMMEFRRAFYSFGKIENLVVDLRGNGGGLLSEAIGMANFFLPKHYAVVSTDGAESRTWSGSRAGEFTEGNLVIIIDGSSASASEIVAGAIQDWDRGVIVGEVSFGKGLVQRQYPLSDGSAVRLTVSRYLTPSGRAIQRPYANGDRENYYSHREERADHVDSLRYKTLRLGREVYGGGGITPDIEIERDTTPLSTEYVQLIRRGVVNKYTLTYLDKNREELLSRYSTFTLYEQNFEVTNKMIESMLLMASEQGLDVSEVDLEILNEELGSYIKALIAQRLYSTSSFYEIINRQDTAIFAPIERLLNNWDSEIKTIWYNHK